MKNQTYFVLINQMRKPMLAGEQAWNCYGERTNAFLLVNYGFCFQDNLNDSFKFMVRLDIDFNKRIVPAVMDMLQLSTKKKDLQEIRLKNNQFNEILMCYIRSCFKEAFLKFNPDVKKDQILLTKPLNLEFEGMCLERYQEIIEVLINSIEKISTLEADLELLNIGKEETNNNKLNILKDIKLT